jgi:tRNA (cmo5U34)-methyltransferase
VERLLLTDSLCEERAKKRDYRLRERSGMSLDDLLRAGGTKSQPPDIASSEKRIGLCSVRPVGSETNVDYDFTLESYLAMMREAVPGYDRLEDEVAAAAGVGAKSILELGTGTGETARRLLDRHQDAQLIGIDASPGMVNVARDSLPCDRVSLLVRRLDDPLPEGPFDLVVSALAVHHLEGARKAELFRCIASRLDPAGRFVLADVVDPVNPSYVVTAIDSEVDHPSKLDEQLAWLEAAGLFPEVTWTHRDLVVVVGSPR